MNGQWKGVVGNDLCGRTNWVKPPKGLDNFLAQQILSNSALLIRLDVKCWSGCGSRRSGPVALARPTMVTHNVTKRMRVVGSVVTLGKSTIVKMHAVWVVSNGLGSYITCMFSVDCVRTCGRATRNMMSNMLFCACQHNECVRTNFPCTLLLTWGSRNVVCRIQIGIIAI